MLAITGFVEAHIFWILIVSGLLTCTMIQGVIAPATQFKTFFGETLPDSPATVLVMRNWSALIALGGVLLVLSAFLEPLRFPIVLFTAVGKLAFAALVFGAGSRFRGHQAYLAALVDTVMVVLFFLYLLPPHA